MGAPALRAIEEFTGYQLYLAHMFYIVTDPTLTELARRLTVVSMSDTIETAAADQAAAVTVETPPAVSKRTRKPRAVAAPEPAPVEKPKRTRKPRAVAAPEPSQAAKRRARTEAATEPAPVKTSETAPVAVLFGGDRNETTWQKLQRGPWPQAMDGATGEPVTPVRAVRLLAESTTGVYIHVERADSETGSPVHMYVHSSIITAWRLMWGPA